MNLTDPPVLHWLPEATNWRRRILELQASADITWDQLTALAKHRLDFTQTNMLHSLVSSVWEKVIPAATAKPLRFAILASATVTHLHASLRIAALRRGIPLTIYQSDFGQYRQELADPASALHAFAPTAVLFAFDPWHVTAGFNVGMTQAEVDSSLAQVESSIVDCWRLARESFGCSVLQQTVMPAFGAIIGNNEHRLPGSRALIVQRLNLSLRRLADEAGVQIVALDQGVAADGLAAWHDVALWHRSKQEVAPGAAPMYGEFVARVLGALQGRSAKCLVLDLDNTIWGGVVGDDGVDGLILGQGSAEGESFVAIQEFAKDLARRGVMLAVCSKNDEANAFEAFDRHPEMVLKRSDIACFVANWNDKATNLRTIAAELNIGLDSLVFLDDNPAERSLVRGELPMVAVPEVGDDPAYYPKAVMDAGYFESIGITDEDRARSEQYQGNRLRNAAKDSATDIPSFLRSLEMTLVWRPFHRAGLARISQLINKTNQFNLTTRRYTEEDVLAVMADSAATGLQLRLIDRFGDNGIIAIVIGKLEQEALAIDTWLMSCRVLGRQVEAATLNLLVDRARTMGAKRLLGHYAPTPKNAMVREHYQKLGFYTVTTNDSGGSASVLDLDTFQHRDTAITLTQG